VIGGIKPAFKSKSKASTTKDTTLKPLMNIIIHGMMLLPIHWKAIFVEGFFTFPFGQVCGSSTKLLHETKKKAS